MFKGYSVSLPLIYNKEDGPFALNKNMTDVIKQNLRTLILTDKGENNASKFWRWIEKIFV